MLSFRKWKKITNKYAFYQLHNICNEWGIVRRYMKSVLGKIQIIKKKKEEEINRVLQRKGPFSKTVALMWLNLL